MVTRMHNRATSTCRLVAADRFQQHEAARPGTQRAVTQHRCAVAKASGMSFAESVLIVRLAVDRGAILRAGP